MVAVALALGIAVQEVPIEWRHDDRSKVRVGRDGLRMVQAIPRILGSRRERHGGPAGDRGVRTGDEVFDDANAAALAEADREHWWFRSKAALVATASAAPQPDRRRPTGGSSTSAAAPAASRRYARAGGPTAPLVVEGNAALCAAARHATASTAARADGRITSRSAGRVADVVCLLDVIEHLADPVAALARGRVAAAARRPRRRQRPRPPVALERRRRCLGHHRRYTRASLQAELDAAGFEPVVLGHVFSWLVPPVWWRRRFRAPDQAELGLDVASPAIDVAAMVLTWCERVLLGRLTMPFGTSLLSVAVARG